MALDLTKIAAQVEGMVARLKDSGEQRQEKLEKALDTLGSATDLARLKEKVARGRTSWLVAEPVEKPDQHYPAAPMPAEFTVIATDGSHIDVDRHQQPGCYLINIGSAVLGYGASPEAVLDNHPRLYSGEEELVMMPPGSGRPQPVEGALLGIKRSVEEYRHLAQTMAELPADVPALGISDGSLILWGLVSQDYPEFVVEALLDNGLIRYLDDIKKLSQKRRLAVGSYISFPRSTDVVNTLRLAICPHDEPNCDRYCADITSGKRECDAVAGISDGELFSGLLDNGERSALFISRSSIVQKRYGSHQVYFCYLMVGDEIARVEMPRWVAEDKDRLELAHSLILDQCRRGHGYPVALAEAHQQAVITTADRLNFQYLVELLLAGEKIEATTSAKSRSKRTRWI